MKTTAVLFTALALTVASHPAHAAAEILKASLGIGAISHKGTFTPPSFMQVQTAGDLTGSMNSAHYFLGNGTLVTRPLGATAIGDGARPVRVTSLGFALTGANPAHSHATFALQLPNAQVVGLRIFSASGRFVQTLESSRSLAAGSHGWTWDGRDAAGHAAPRGLYLARLTAGTSEHTTRFLFVE